MKGAFVFRRPRFVSCPGWLSASDALERLARRLRSEAKARTLLISQLADGAIRAGARCVMMDYDVCPIPQKAPERKTSMHTSRYFSGIGKNLTVPVHLFSVDKDGSTTNDVDLTNDRVVRRLATDLTLTWAEGENSPTMHPPRREIYYKLEVEEHAINELLAAAREAPARWENRGQRDRDSDGNRNDMTPARWREILAPLWQLAEAGKLEDETGAFTRGTQTQLMEIIQDRLNAAGESASVSTRRRRANELKEANDKAKERVLAANGVEPS